MTSRSLLRRAAAFTLVELLVVIAIIALLISILLPGLACARVNAKQSQSTGNLKQYAISTQSYSSDFQDRIWAFTWRAAFGGRPVNFRTNYPDLSAPTDGNDVEAAHFQAVDILRRRAPNRDQGTDMFPRQFVGIQGWIPHIYYSHLVLLDYLAARLPEPMVRSPLDRLRGQWAEDPLAAAAQLAASNVAPALSNHRWPYSSSYTISTATFTPDKWSADGGSLLSISWNTFQYNVGTSGGYRLGNRRLGDVAFPGSKVHVYETISRACGRPPKNELPFIFNGAKTFVTTFAGSVQLVAMNTANKGGYTRFNASPTGGVSAAPIDYSTPNPGIGDPPWPGNPAIAANAPAYFRHTVGGLKGLDFGAKDIHFTNYTAWYPGS